LAWGSVGSRPWYGSGVLDRLQARGLVDRRPNPTDRRSTLIILSAAGHDVARHVAEAFERVAARIPDDTAAEAQRLLRVLDEALAEPPGGQSGAARRRPE
jgi:DNA-binding MarR family transcriptional regulator